MNDRTHDEFFRDLARLLAKHGPEQWRQLISALHDDSSRERITTALETLAAVAGRTSKRQTTPLTTRRASVLSDLEEQDPQKHDVLASARGHMLDRTLLGSAKALEDFARMCGIEGPLPSKRPQAVNVVLRDLARRPLEELEKLLKQAGPPEPARGRRDFGAEYEHWVDLILRRRR